MRRAAVPALLCAAIAVPGCASGEKEFDAPGFVDEANDSGASLQLGDRLPSAREDVEVYELQADPAGISVTGEESEHAHGGSLTVAADADAARTEFERCDGAVSLTCYRAANIVVAFQGDAADPELVAVESAIRLLASD